MHICSCRHLSNVCTHGLGEIQHIYRTSQTIRPYALHIFNLDHHHSHIMRLHLVTLIYIFHFHFSSIWNCTFCCSRCLLNPFRFGSVGLCLHRNCAKAAHHFHLNDCICTPRNLLNKHIMLSLHARQLLRVHYTHSARTGIKRKRERKKTFFEKLHQIKSIIAIR